MRQKSQIIEVWGDLACFSRPELKVERFSYPLITPSAARGIFDAIYSKPNKDPSRAQFRWQIRKIEVLQSGTYIALMRNEVKDVANVKAVEKWMRGSRDPEPILADGKIGLHGSPVKGVTQRQTMALRDVRYRLHAEIHPWPGHECKLSSFEEQFQRRVARGKCYFQPCLGCREFPAYFQFPNQHSPVVDWTQRFGWMLYDVFDLSRPGTAFDRPSISMFLASIDHGVLNVPDYADEAVKKGAQEV